MVSRRTLSWDWYPGTIPDNVVLGEAAYLETTLSFELYRSQTPVGLQLGRGTAIYKDTMFDTGTQAQIRIGDYALIHGVRLICDREIEIGNYALLSWRVVLMDSYRIPLDPIERRQLLIRVPQQELRWMGANVPARPIHIGDNTWIGFDTCILPGVTIGEGSIVGARSVVFKDVPPYTLVAGNPARVIRHLRQGETIYG